MFSRIGRVINFFGMNFLKTSLSLAKDARCISAHTSSVKGPVDRKSIRIVCISDTHSTTDKMELPKGDLLVHSGDFTQYSRIEEFKKFNAFCQNAKETSGFQEVVVIAGNHEMSLDPSCSHASQKALGIEYPLAPEYFRRLLTNCIYLENTEVSLFGGKLRVYGTPANRMFKNSKNKAFCFNDSDLQMELAKIPTGVDVLLTHMPPFGILDWSPTKEKNSGSVYIRSEVMERVKPKLHVFGHLHEGNLGLYHLEAGTTYINASICDEINEPTRKIHVIDFVSTLIPLPVTQSFKFWSRITRWSLQHLFDKAQASAILPGNWLGSILTDFRQNKVLKNDKVTL